ncbi:hypothetical protein ACFQ1S_11340 [Kibdelosporangium lantanae]|uniref:VapC45 PIN like domain-containing protein n=1 Tax=Kibdelosporangium lantanae TaxID=1497396 RepID=A0ABW3M918_9PSEU
MPHEFFLDRGLGRRVAEGLAALGWTVHRIVDHFPNDAQDVENEVWLTYGLEQGWSPMCKTVGSRAGTWSEHRWKVTVESCSTSTTSGCSWPR